MQVERTRRKKRTFEGKRGATPKKRGVTATKRKKKGALDFIKKGGECSTPGPKRPRPNKGATKKERRKEKNQNSTLKNTPVIKPGKAQKKRKKHRWRIRQKCPIERNGNPSQSTKNPEGEKEDTPIGRDEPRGKNFPNSWVLVFEKKRGGPSKSLSEARNNQKKKRKGGLP